MQRPPALLIAVFLFALLSAGCVDYSPSAVPDPYLHSESGNGWALFERRPPEPQSQSLGLVKTQTLVYRDPGETGESGNGGYPASLSVISFEVAFNEPDRDELTTRARDQVEKKAEELGVELEKPPEAGKRRVAAGDEAQYFLYDGTVTDDSSLFTREADVKVAGVVWNCAEAGHNTVVAVALAQVNERTAGTIEDRNPKNWDELWRDAASGGERDGGLIVNVSCG